MNSSSGYSLPLSFHINQHVFFSALESRARSIFIIFGSFVARFPESWSLFRRPSPLVFRDSSLKLLVSMERSNMAETLQSMFLDYFSRWFLSFSFFRVDSFRKRSSTKFHFLSLWDRWEKMFDDAVRALLLCWIWIVGASSLCLWLMALVSIGAWSRKRHRRTYQSVERNIFSMKSLNGSAMETRFFLPRNESECWFHCGHSLFIVIVWERASDDERLTEES